MQVPKWDKRNLSAVCERLDNLELNYQAATQLGNSTSACVDYENHSEWWTQTKKEADFKSVSPCL
jgi:hypothetical protein